MSRVLTARTLHPGMTVVVVALVHHVWKSVRAGTLPQPVKTYQNES